MSPKAEQPQEGCSGLSGRPPSLGEHRGRTPSVLLLVPRAAFKPASGPAEVSSAQFSRRGPRVR